MKSKKTTILTTFALILMLAVPAFIISIPAANAHTPAWNVQTYAFLSLSPNPVGVGQTVIVAFWLNIVPPTANGQYGDRWQNMTVIVTDPTGTKKTLGLFTSDPAGSSYTYFTPNSIGTYTFQMFYPGQTLAGANPPPVPNSYSNSANIGDYFQPSTSEVETLVVQQQQIPGWTSTPLPTGYWTNPVDAQNRDWNTISGNWLGTGVSSRGSNWYNATANFNAYTTCPGSGHIVWTKPLSLGGILGGEFGNGGSSDYYMGSAYEPFLRPPIIIDGNLYYSTPNPPRYGFYCVDLRTGQQIWYNNGTNAPPTTYSAGSYTWPQLTVGQVINYITPNQYGGLAYLWYTGSSNYYMYDATTGNYILTLTNASTGTIVMDPNGNMLVYILDATHSRLIMWNSTLAIAAAFASTPAYAPQTNGYWLWRPPTGTYDWRAGIQMNVSIPNIPGQSIKAASPPVIWARSTTATTQTPTVIDIGYNATDGSVLWGPTNRTGDEAFELGIGTYSSTVGGWAVGDGVFCVVREETEQWWGYNLYTGQKMWGPSIPNATNAWSVYPGAADIAYGMLFVESADGVHVYNVTTGARLWDLADIPSGIETAYGVWPTEAGGMLIADGKVLVPIGHSHLQPLFRGAALLCIDAYTGQELWNVTGWYAPGAGSSQSGLVIADGYIVGMNGYDNEIYCLGKGLSATTVTATPGLQNAVTIQGTVTDQSPGQTSIGIPAAGTPAISDNSMSAWMAYLYMEQPKPTSATGVTVTLTAFDPNNNTEIIGNATSDINGHYGLMWTPPVPGYYTIIATFSGTNSYYSSTAETSLAVGTSPSPATVATAAPTPPPTPTSTPTVSSTPTATPSPQVTNAPTPPGSSGVPVMTFVAVAAAVIIIAVIAAAIVLRRRK